MSARDCSHDFTTADALGYRWCLWCNATALPTGEIIEQEIPALDELLLDFTTAELVNARAEIAALRQANHELALAGAELGGRAERAEADLADAEQAVTDLGIALDRERRAHRAHLAGQPTPAELTDQGLDRLIGELQSEHPLVTLFGDRRAPAELTDLQRLAERVTDIELTIRHWNGGRNV